MPAYVLEGPRWATGAAGTSGGVVTWALDGTVPASFVPYLTAAFATWASYANIAFQRVTSVASSNIDFSDTYIDGLDGTLGEATYYYYSNDLRMISAEITFDIGEGWHTSGNQIVSNSGADLYIVALHEIGHALGIDHYNEAPAVMNSVLTGTVTDLTASDISAIQALYGVRTTSVTYGGKAADELRGGSGSDTLNGRSGNDYLYGQDGDDTLYGEAGVDALFGGSGRDTLIGGADKDYLYGEAGVDALYGEAGDDVLIAGAESDYLYGQDGLDFLYGEAGQDALFGGAERDVLYGQEGGDYLYGEAGNDQIEGGAGADSVTGGTGNDTLYGQGEGDYFYFLGTFGQDTVADFSRTEGDRIVFSASEVNAQGGVGRAYYEGADMTVFSVATLGQIYLNGNIGFGDIVLA